jgi:hypothetical protein
LAFHRAEFARLTKALEAATPNSRRAGFLRATLQLHEEVVARSEGRAARSA